MEWCYLRGLFRIKQSGEQSSHPGPGLVGVYTYTCMSVYPSIPYQNSWLYLTAPLTLHSESTRRGWDAGIRAETGYYCHVCRLSDFNFSSGCERTTITKPPFIFHPHPSGKLYFVIV